MATEAQVAANRVNGLKGGVKSEAGKAVSRLNARKHGIFASALTSEDARELRGIEGELAAELGSVGLVEGILIEKLAVTYLRMQRCARVESEHYKTWRLDTMQGVRARCEKKLEAFGMHDVRLTNQFLRLLHELKSLQRERSRQGDNPHKEVDSPRSKANGCMLGGGNDESQAGAPVPQEMKNEPNSGADAPESNLAPRPLTEHKVGLAQVEMKMQNEPNPRRFPNAECRMPNVAEVKNEPNLATADCRLPIAECSLEVKNEPNSPPVPVAVHGGNGQLTETGCQLPNVGQVPALLERAD